MEANDSLTDKCIYLDLDQTLIATADEEHGMDDLYDVKLLSDPSLIHLRNRFYHVVVEDLEKPGYGSKYEMWGITRPHLHDFLLFCFSYFKLVMVYSAGKRQYVEEIVDHIFKDLPYPHLVLSYDDIVMDGKKITKPINKVINGNELTRKYVKETNTFGLDDLNTTYSKNIGNGILIPRYDPDSNLVSTEPRDINYFIKELEKNDDALLKLKKWLMLPEVMNSEDVRLLDKNDIFYLKRR